MAENERKDPEPRASATAGVEAEEATGHIPATVGEHAVERQGESTRARRGPMTTRGVADRKR
ncbi:MAG TPA: hypothetical protein VIL43_03155 [Burkholderiales bacterium]